jgi:hypothetical protein
MGARKSTGKDKSMDASKRRYTYNSMDAGNIME